MTASTVVRRGERFDREQIVVDIEHREAVEGLLRDSGLAGATGTGESLPELGLTLLSVPDLAARAQHLPDAERLRAGLREELGDEPSDLDVLLRHLRQLSRERYAGWTPTMGKNRDLESIGGLPHIGGGEGAPEPVDAVTFGARPEGSLAPFAVGVLDSAMVPNPALNGRYVTGHFLRARAPFRPFQGHATFIAGRVLQRAPGAVLDVRRVLRDDNGRASSWDVAKGMASFLGSGVRVLNMSFGTVTKDAGAPFVLERAVDRLAGEMVLVAAAGNHANDDTEELEHRDVPDDVATVPVSAESPMWPAALPNVVAVAAEDATGGRAPFSPFDLPWIDLYAPGVDVASTFLTGDVDVRDALREDGRVVLGPPRRVEFRSGYARWNGTSFAAADVSGEIARVAQAKGVTAREALSEITSRRHGDGHDVHAHRP
jgi:subtilisin family serine protease